VAIPYMSSDYTSPQYTSSQITGVLVDVFKRMTDPSFLTKVCFNCTVSPSLCSTGPPHYYQPLLSPIYYPAVFFLSSLNSLSLPPFPPARPLPPALPLPPTCYLLLPHLLPATYSPPWHHAQYLNTILLARHHPFLTISFPLLCHLVSAALPSPHYVLIHDGSYWSPQMDFLEKSISTHVLPIYGLGWHGFPVWLNRPTDVPAPWYSVWIPVQGAHHLPIQSSTSLPVLNPG
jgi:hypothetical protein